MCADYWVTLHDPVMGRTPQKPFEHGLRAQELRGLARHGSADGERRSVPEDRWSRCSWRTRRAAPAYLTADAETLRRGKIAFADKCAQCHSSKQPPAEIAADRAKVDAWYRESVLSRRLPDDNFLSDDKRYPVSQLGTNIARAVATNAIAGQHVGSSSRRRPTRSCRASGSSRASTTRAIPTSRSTSRCRAAAAATTGRRR